MRSFVVCGWLWGLSCVAHAGAPEATPVGMYEDAGFTNAPVEHWRVRLPGGRVNSATHTERATPVVFGDEILVGAAAGNGIYRLSRADGGLRANYPSDASVQSRPLILDQTVVFSDISGDTYAYSRDGTLRWRHDGRAPILASPLGHEGSVYITDVEDRVVALHAETGALLWQYQQRRDPTRRSGLSLYAAPQGVPLGDQGVLFGSGYFKPFIALDVETSALKWRHEVGSASTPVVTPHGVILHPGTDGVLRAYEILTGDLQWMWDSLSQAALTSPVATDAGLLVGVGDGTLVLIDEATGEETWRYRNDFILQGITAKPVVSGRQAIFVTNAGWVYSLLSPQ
jgi:outer membrane protein assembly factor BamB